MITRLIFLFLLLTLICTKPSQAQEPLSKFFETKSNGNKLNIQSILFDYQGNLLCGTSEGLMQFDGIDFQHVFDSDSMPVQEVSSIFQGSKTRVWVGYKNGKIAYIDHSKIFLFKHDKSLPSVQITSFAEDSINGRLFYSTLGEGLFYVENGQVHEINSKNGLSDDYCYKLLLLPDHRLCVATDQGINYIKFEGDNFSISTLSSEQGLSDNIVRSLTLNPANNLLASFQDGGFCIIDPTADKSPILFQSEEWKYGQVNTALPVGEEIWLGTEHYGVVRLKYNTINDKFDELPSGITNTNIKAMLRDSENQVWVASANQLIRSSGECWNKILNPSGTNFAFVHCILSDHAGNIWFSPDQQLYCAKKQSNGTYEFIKYTVTKPNALTDIVTLQEDERNNIWIGTLGEGIFVLDPKRKVIYKPGTNTLIQNGNVMSIEIQTDQILIGGFGGIQAFEKNYNSKTANYILTPLEKEVLEPLKNNYIYSIHTDRNNVTWFGSDESGLISYTGHKLHYYSKKDGLPSMTIQSITSDSSGKLWLATQGGGISSFDGKTFVNISMKEGLSDPSPVSISIDKNDHVVIVHSNGVDIFDPETKTFQYYSSESGLGEINPDLNSISTGPNGIICIGTERGIFTFNPTENFLWKQPKVYINSVLLFLEPLADASTMKFDYDQNNITFRYNSPWYTDQNRITYSYQLDGFSQKWQSTKDHSVSYPKLPPGNYTFRVRASLNQNYLSASEASFIFEIKSPFWQTIWFRLLLSLCILLIIGFIIRRRELRLRKTEKAEKEKIEFRFETLRNQVNPHFLFNSFNTLITVIEKDPNLAVEYVENLSQFFRSIVSYKDVEVISLEEEIGLLENYIFIQSKRYGDSLKFINKVDLKIAPDGFIPPLTLQLLAENALKHNAISHESPLLLELFIKDGYLVMRNNINPKYHKEESTGIGLQNIKNRFNILGDQKIEIEVDQDFFNVSVPILKEI